MSSKDGIKISASPVFNSILINLNFSGVRSSPISLHYSVELVNTDILNFGYEADISIGTYRRVPANSK